MNIKELPTDIVECLEWTLQAQTSLANTNSTDRKANRQEERLNMSILAGTGGKLELTWKKQVRDTLRNNGVSYLERQMMT